MAILHQHYGVVTEDWKVTIYMRIRFHWDYTKNKVHISMPGYITKALIFFQHDTKKLCHAPHLYTPPSYDQKVQLAKVQRSEPILSS